MGYTFLSDGSVSKADIEALIGLTEAGMLRWYQHDQYAAYSADPVNDQANALITPSLQGVRVGFVDETQEVHYVRMNSSSGKKLYLEDAALTELMPHVSELHDLIRRATRLGGMIASERDTAQFCDTCQADTPHRYLVNRPHGLSGAVMSGTERLVCTRCEHAELIAKHVSA